MAKCLSMGWREDFVKLDEAWQIAKVFLGFLVGLGFMGYALYRAFRG